MSEHGAGECRPHVAVEVWMAAGGRGLWIKSPIPVTGLWDEGWKKGLVRGCWRRSTSPLYLL